MIRRCGIALLFAILGIASLLLLGSIDAKLSEISPVYQRWHAGFQKCGLDCSQSWSGLEQAKAILFFFGPSMVFAIVAFLFSQLQRRIFTWSVLLVSLVVTHALVMLVVLQMAIK